MLVSTDGELTGARNRDAEHDPPLLTPQHQQQQPQQHASNVRRYTLLHDSILKNMNIYKDTMEE